MALNNFGTGFEHCKAMREATRAVEGIMGGSATQAMVEIDRAAFGGSANEAVRKAERAFDSTLGMLGGSSSPSSAMLAAERAALLGSSPSFAMLAAERAAMLGSSATLEAERARFDSTLGMLGGNSKAMLAAERAALLGSSPSSAMLAAERAAVFGSAATLEAERARFDSTLGMLGGSSKAMLAAERAAMMGSSASSAMLAIERATMLSSSPIKTMLEAERVRFDSTQGMVGGSSKAMLEASRAALLGRSASSAMLSSSPIKAMLEAERVRFDSTLGSRAALLGSSASSTMLEAERDALLGSSAINAMLAAEPARFDSTQGSKAILAAERTRFESILGQTSSFGFAPTHDRKLHPFAETGDLHEELVALLPEINVIVECTLCGDSMISEVEHEPGEGCMILRVRVMPVCLQCARRTVEDPEYLAECLRQVEPSMFASDGESLEVLDGEGLGDGVQRGLLRLISKKIEEPKSSED